MGTPALRAGRTPIFPRSPVRLAVQPPTPSTLERPLADLPDPLPIPPLSRPFDVSIRPPGSKSLTNRALLLAALAEGTSTLRHALVDADDAQVMLRAIQALGASVTPDPSDPTTLRITGVGGRWRVPAGGVTLNLNNAGTATRFLAASSLLTPPGSAGLTIDGDARMRERPILELGDALKRVGAQVEYLGTPGCPPLRVRVPESPDALRWIVTLGTTRSSQFISALLLVAPLLPKGLEVELWGTITSEPYVDMTVGLLRRVGIANEVLHGTDDRSPRPMTLIRHKPQRLLAFELDIEADASGASYFLAAAALVPGATCRIHGVPATGSLQGDSGFAAVVHAMTGQAADPGGLSATGSARLRPVDADLSGIPDTAMTAAVLACFASGVSTLHGLRTLRVKETDRLAALQTELQRIGATVEIVSEQWRGEEDEALRISPPADMGTEPVVFQTYHDHRMAMALSLVGLRRPNVFIADPGCVAKTYPTFFADLARLY